ncbi:MAG: STAS domain-containing protein [Planctomycetota bacterium]|jgi:anti-anti-sigma factor
MKITTRDSNDITVVMFEGELDTLAAPDAKSELNKMRARGAKKIILDLEKLDFITSSGLRVLLATAQELNDVSGELRVCNLNETVQEVFDISGFSTLLMVFENEAKAMIGL